MTPTRRLIYMIEEKMSRLLGEPATLTLMVPAKGYWRTRHADVMSWQAHVTVGKVRYIVGSWQNITVLVRKDFTFSDDRHDQRASVDFEAHAMDS